MHKKLKKLFKLAAPIVGAAFGGPLGGAIGGALGGGGVKGALTGALLAPAAVGGFAALRQGASFADIARTVAGTLTTGGPRFQTPAEQLFAPTLTQASPPGAPPLPQATAMAMGGQLVPVGGGGGFPQLMDDSGRLVQTGAFGLAGRGFGAAAGGLARMAGNLVLSAAGRIRGVIGLGGQFISSKRVMSGAKILGLAGTSAALGIAVDEVAQIVLQESVKRRRARGISAASLRTTRRVTRRIISMHQDLSRLCGQSFRLRSRVVRPST